MMFSTGAALFASALLVGGMVFFLAVVAPLVFSRLPPTVNGPFIRQVFPVYYLYVGVTAAAAAVALMLSRPLDAGIMAAVAAVTVWLRQVLMRRINAWSDAAAAGDASARPRFASGHRLSVILNFAQLIAAGVVLARFV